jgi:Fe-S cluster assembly protein SufD
MESGHKDQSWCLLNFQQFERCLNGHASAPIHKLRKEAFENFTRMGFPTPKQEDWKYTNVAEVERSGFTLAERPSEMPDARKLAARPYAGGEIEITIVNGFYMPDSAPCKLPKGLEIRPLAELLDSSSAEPAMRAYLESHLARYADFKNHPFVAMNTAFMQDGVVLIARKGAVITQPVHLKHLVSSSECGIAVYPRTLIVVEESAQITVVESYTGPNDCKYLTNPVSEMVVGENAVLDHYRLEQEGNQSFHIASMQVQEARNANFRTHTFSFGGKLVRHDISLSLNGEGIESTLNGLTVLDGEQHVDNHTTLDHRKPNCLSHELFKGIYADRSAGVFNGTIIVQKDAQKTNAIQSNQSLLLSADATIDAKPQLKIWADDVKCTHGATVGQLDDDALFYIRSRGVPKESARNMLIHAFASDVIKEVKLPDLRDYLEDVLSVKLDNRS